MRTEVLCISVLRVASGPRVKLASCKSSLINVKKIAFGNKEHTTDKKMGVSVLLRLFISSNEVCKTAYAL